MSKLTLNLSRGFTGDPELANLKRLHQRHAHERATAKEIVVGAWSVPVESMRNPVTLMHSYRIMGLLLGSLPPTAIFWRHFGYGTFNAGLAPGSEFLSLIFLLMNVVCAGVGYGLGGVVGRLLTRARYDAAVGASDPRALEYLPWLSYSVALPFAAALWGVVTGAAGGAVFFGIGILYGPVFAVPVALLGMSGFSLLHRLAQRDGMIEARLLWTISAVVTLFITAWIMVAPPGAR